MFSMLNKEQLEAVTYGDGPILVLSGAGSGKTLTLTCRIAHLISRGIDSLNIMAVTFTNKAANEMKERLNNILGSSSSSMWIGTFHSLCLRILRSNINQLQYSPNFTIADDNDTLKIISDICKNMGIDVHPRAIRDAISVFKTDLISWDKAQVSAKSSGEKAIAEVYRLYQTTLVSNNCMDFDDIIFNTVLLLRDNPTILARYRNQFKYILTDEYQDCNYAQYEFLHLLCSEHRNIFAVGDDFQSIFGWRGADISMILNFERDYPDAKVVKLEQNYRSTKFIIEAANAVIAHNKNQKKKVLWTDNPSGEPVYIHSAFSDKDEAQWIASAIKYLIGTYDFKPRDFAILYRTNYQAVELEKAMLSARLPYVVANNTAFYQRKEIKDVIAYMKVIMNPHDQISLERIINEPKRGIGTTTISKIKKFAEENNLTLIEAARKMAESRVVSNKVCQGITELLTFLDEFPRDCKLDIAIKRILRDTGYKDYLLQDEEKNDDRLINLNRLEEVCELYCKELPGAGIETFLMDVSLMSDQDRLDSDSDVVKLMTVHNSKGLEFPIVFVAGLEDGLFPSYRYEENSNIEEERRLFYVALTRAQKAIYLCYARTRATFQGGEPYKIIQTTKSRFLNEIPKEMTYIV